MSRDIIKLTLFMAVCFLPLGMFAQSACDKLFSTGIKYQQTMTVSSQWTAISNFEKAKECYDSDSKKELCDQQIKTCRNIISQLNKSAENASSESKAESASEKTVMNAEQKEEETKQESRKDVTLSLDCTYVKFGAGGGDFKKVHVNCNYSDWEITDVPGWVSVSKNEDEIVIEAEKNTLSEERSATLVIECGDKSVTLTIIQSKKKKFGVI